MPTAIYLIRNTNPLTNNYIDYKAYPCDSFNTNMNQQYFNLLLHFPN